MDMKKVSVLIAICLCSARLASANDGLRFADVFTDNMVLQRGKDLSCWGTAPAGSLVEVLLTQSREDAIAFAGKDALVREHVGSSPRNPIEGIEKVRLAYVEEAPSPFHPVTRSVTADESGKWLVTLGEHKASYTPTFLAARVDQSAIAIQMQLAAEESLLLLTKRYAHPKGILMSTVSAMQKLVDTFEVESYRTLAPELRMQALYNIPVRYWDRSKYTPARRAKWGWLLERILMLDTLPQEMNMAIDQPGVSARLAELKTAISALQAELSKLPDPEPMRFDRMLDQVLLEMQKERERLSSDGHDMKKQRNELSQNLF